MKLLSKIKNHWANVKFSVCYMARISPSFIFITIVSAFLTAAYSVFQVYYIKIVIATLQDKNISYFFTLVFFVFILTLAINILNNSLSHYFTPILNNKINKKIKQDIYDAYLNYSSNEINNPEFYDLYSYVLNNSVSSLSSVVSILGNMLSNIFSIIGISALFSQYDKTTLLIIYASVLLGFIITTVLEKKRYNFNIELVPYHRAFNYIERIFYLPQFSDEVHVYKSKTIFNEYFEAKNNDILSIIKKWRTQFFSLNLFNNAISALMNLSILIRLGIQFFNTVFTLDVFAMLFNGTQQLFSHIFSFLSLFTQSYSVSLNITKFNTFMSGCNMQGNVFIDKIEKINVCDASFYYGDIQVIKSVSFTFEKNENQIAIVGKNGSGKSTLAKMIVGLLPCKDKSVFINGHDINVINRDSLFTTVAVLFQKYLVFSFSIAQNILLKYDITKEDEEKIIAVLKLVRLYDKVMSLEQGMHTIISSEFDASGVMLSGGEMQRIALARVLVSNASLVIFDEPYSSLDLVSEQEIAHLINTISKNKKVILISHKLSLLNTVDKILVLDKGKIAEQGTPEILLSDDASKVFKIFS